MTTNEKSSEGMTIEGLSLLFPAFAEEFESEQVKACYSRFDEQSAEASRLETSLAAIAGDSSMEDLYKLGSNRLGMLRKGLPAALYAAREQAIKRAIEMRLAGAVRSIIASEDGGSMFRSIAPQVTLGVSIIRVQENGTDIFTVMAGQRPVNTGTKNATPKSSERKEVPGRKTITVTVNGQTFTGTSNKIGRQVLAALGTPVSGGEKNFRLMIENLWNEGKVEVSVPSASA